MSNNRENGQPILGNGIPTISHELHEGTGADSPSALTTLVEETAPEHSTPEDSIFDSPQGNGSVNSSETSHSELIGLQPNLQAAQPPAMHPPLPNNSSYYPYNSYPAFPAMSAAELMGFPSIAEQMAMNAAEATRILPDSDNTRFHGHTAQFLEDYRPLNPGENLFETVDAITQPRRFHNILGGWVREIQTEPIRLPPWNGEHEFQELGDQMDGSGDGERRGGRRSRGGRRHGRGAGRGRGRGRGGGRGGYGNGGGWGQQGWDRY